MTDIVARLRWFADRRYLGTYTDADVDVAFASAADEIERLRGLLRGVMEYQQYLPFSLRLTIANALRAPVQPEVSRSIQRRVALQKGEPMPEFDEATSQPEYAAAGHDSRPGPYQCKCPYCVSTP